MQDQLFCFLDVLGFSNLVENEALDSIHAKYEKLIAAANQQQHNGLVFSSWAGHPYFSYEVLESAYFSDTIVFWCPYDVRFLQSLALSMKEVLCQSIEVGLPLRGAISVGQAILNKEKNEFIGRPVVSATKAEKVQCWIGITLSSDFREPPFNGGFSADCFIPYELHLKEDGLQRVTPLVLDFPRRWRGTRQSSLQSAVSALDRKPEFSIYYKNTLDFVEFSHKSERWWETHPDFKNRDT